MPLSAIHAQTGERCLLWCHHSPRSLRVEDWVCPSCESPMTVVVGQVRRPHFRHLPLERSSSCDLASKGESPQHLAMKSRVAEELARVYSDATVSIERRVCLPDGRHRCVDVLVEHPGGVKEAHEIQFSPIKTEQLDARTEDYLSLGISPFWWFGLRGNTIDSIEWAADKFGELIVVPDELVHDQAKRWNARGRGLDKEGPATTAARTFEAGGPAPPPSGVSSDPRSPERGMGGGQEKDRQAIGRRP